MLKQPPKQPPQMLKNTIRTYQQQSQHDSPIRVIGRCSSALLKSSSPIRFPAERPQPLYDQSKMQKQPQQLRPSTPILVDKEQLKSQMLAKQQQFSSRVQSGLWKDDSQSAKYSANNTSIFKEEEFFGPENAKQFNLLDDSFEICRSRAATGRRSEIYDHGIDALDAHKQNQRILTDQLELCEVDPNIIKQINDEFSYLFDQITGKNTGDKAQLAATKALDFMAANLLKQLNQSKLEYKILQESYEELQRIDAVHKAQLSEAAKAEAESFGLVARLQFEVSFLSEKSQKQVALLELQQEQSQSGFKMLRETLKKNDALAYANANLNSEFAALKNHIASLQRSLNSALSHAGKVSANLTRLEEERKELQQKIEKQRAMFSAEKQQYISKLIDYQQKFDCLVTDLSGLDANALVIHAGRALYQLQNVSLSKLQDIGLNIEGILGLSYLITNSRRNTGNVQKFLNNLAEITEFGKDARVQTENSHLRTESTRLASEAKSRVSVQGVRTQKSQQGGAETHESQYSSHLRTESTNLVSEVRTRSQGSPLFESQELGIQKSQQEEVKTRESQQNRETRMELDEVERSRSSISQEAAGRSSSVNQKTKRKSVLLDQVPISEQFGSVAAVTDNLLNTQLRQGSQARMSSFGLLEVNESSHFGRNQSIPRSDRSDLVQSAETTKISKIKVVEAVQRIAHDLQLSEEQQQYTVRFLVKLPLSKQMKQPKLQNSLIVSDDEVFHYNNNNSFCEQDLIPDRKLADQKLSEIISNADLKLACEDDIEQLQMNASHMYGLFGPINDGLDNEKFTTQPLRLSVSEVTDSAENSTYVNNEQSVVRLQQPIKAKVQLPTFLIKQSQLDEGLLNPSKLKLSMQLSSQVRQYQSIILKSGTKFQLSQSKLQKELQSRLHKNDYIFLTRVIMQFDHIPPLQLERADKLFESLISRNNKYLSQEQLSQIRQISQIYNRNKIVGYKMEASAPIMQYNGSKNHSFQKTGNQLSQQNREPNRHQNNCRFTIQDSSASKAQPDFVVNATNQFIQMRQEIEAMKQNEPADKLINERIQQLWKIGINQKNTKVPIFNANGFQIGFINKIGQYEYDTEDSQGKIVNGPYVAVEEKDELTLTAGIQLRLEAAVDKIFAVKDRNPELQQSIVGEIQIEKPLFDQSLKSKDLEIIEKAIQHQQQILQSYQCGTLQSRYAQNKKFLDQTDPSEEFLKILISDEHRFSSSKIRLPLSQQLPEIEEKQLLQVFEKQSLVPPKFQQIVDFRFRYQKENKTLFAPYILDADQLQSDLLCNTIKLFQYQKEQTSKQNCQLIIKNMIPNVGETVNFIRTDACMLSGSYPLLFQNISVVYKVQFDIISINSQKYYKLPVLASIRKISWIVKGIQTVYAHSRSFPHCYVVQDNDNQQFRNTIYQQGGVDLFQILLKYANAKVENPTLELLFLCDFVANVVYHQFENPFVYLFARFLFNDVSVDMEQKDQYERYLKTTEVPQLLKSVCYSLNEFQLFFIFQQLVEVSSNETVGLYDQVLPILLSFYSGAKRQTYLNLRTCFRFLAGELGEIKADQFKQLLECSQLSEQLDNSSQNALFFRFSGKGESGQTMTSRGLIQLYAYHQLGQFARFSSRVLAGFVPSTIARRAGVLSSIMIQLQDIHRVVSKLKNVNQSGIIQKYLLLSASDLAVCDNQQALNNLQQAAQTIVNVLCQLRPGTDVVFLKALIEQIRELILY